MTIMDSKTLVKLGQVIRSHLSRSSRSDPVYDMTQILHWVTMASGPNQSNELSMLDSDDGNI